MIFKEIILSGGPSSCIHRTRSRSGGAAAELGHPYSDVVVGYARPLTSPTSSLLPLVAHLITNLRMLLKNIIILEKYDMLMSLLLTTNNRGAARVHLPSSFAL